MVDNDSCHFGLLRLPAWPLAGNMAQAWSVTIHGLLAPRGGGFFMKANEDTPGQGFSLPTRADKLASQESYLPLSE